MPELNGYEWLLYGGAALMAISIVTAGAFLIWTHFRKKELKEHLDREYGPA